MLHWPPHVCGRPVRRLCEILTTNRTTDATHVVDCVWNMMAHAQKPDFVFRRNGRVHLNPRGRQFSRLLATEVCASAVLMLDTPCSEVVWRVLATHSIRQFPFHFPSGASPCAITFQLDSSCDSGCNRPKLVPLFLLPFTRRFISFLFPHSSPQVGNTHCHRHNRSAVCKYANFTNVSRTLCSAVLMWINILYTALSVSTVGTGSFPG